VMSVALGKSIEKHDEKSVIFSIGWPAIRSSASANPVLTLIKWGGLREVGVS